MGSPDRRSLSHIPTSQTERKAMPPCPPVPTNVVKAHSAHERCVKQGTALLKKGHHPPRGSAMYDFSYFWPNVSMREVGAVQISTETSLEACANATCTVCLYLARAARRHAERIGQTKVVGLSHRAHVCSVLLRLETRQTMRQRPVGRFKSHEDSQAFAAATFHVRALSDEQHFDTASEPRGL